MTAACGIDFGTSNSAVALADASRARLVALQGDATTVPTALFYGFEDGIISFGREAMRRYLARDEGRLLRSIKSLLGTALYDETTFVRTRRLAFSEIIAEFLRFLRARAEAGRGEAPREVVIGRPAFFVDDDAAADRKAHDQLEAAARLAGFETIAFQFEPIAAALDYEQTVAAEEIALVADIGGGTSDFSVVRVGPMHRSKSDRRGDILGTTGVHIGGTDFDRLLSMATLMPFLGLNSALKAKGMSAPSWYFVDLATWHRVNFLYDRRVIAEIRTVLRDSAEPDKIARLLRAVENRLGHELLARIETAKIELSSETAARMALAGVADGLALRLARRTFEKAVGDSLARISGRVRDVLQLSGLAPHAVSTIFLTGGTAGVPAVRAAIASALPEARVVTGDAFGSVATGLALDARRRFGTR